MRVVVVDDVPSQRDGRVLWLTRIPDVDAEGMTFEQAAALGPGWRDVQIAVLDGHDRRSPNRREEAASDAGISPLPTYDRFVGARVAALIREHSDPESTLIILISAHARDSDERARRIAQSGVDFVFEHYEVEVDAETFVRAVLHPESFSRPGPRRTDWAAHGYSREPDIAGAISAIESSDAGSMLLDDAPHRAHRELAWSLRSLRVRLQDLLQARLPPGSGPRERRAAPKAWLASKLRNALGLDLPVDPD
jgi:hypothetical protein